MRMWVAAALVLLVVVGLDASRAAPGGFVFQVDFGGGQTVTFAEFGGLDTARPEGDGKSLAGRSPPAMKTYVTLKKAVTANRAVLAWIGHAGDAFNPPKPRTIIVKLINENDPPAMTWKLDGCLPVKASFNDAKPGESGTGIGALKIVCENLEIAPQ